MIQLNCKICGSSFEVFPCNKRKYCSRLCYLKDKNKTVPLKENRPNFIKDEDVPDFEINDEISAYFLGFLQTDGHLQHKYVSIEINSIDSKILIEFQKKFGGKIFYRTRKTNFSDKSELVGWRIGSVAFVKQMNRLGIPCGKKSDIVRPISMSKEMEKHYIRGLIDGDGSLSITKQGNPLIGFVTSSEEMKIYFENWLKSLDIVCHIKRNTRDNIYSFCILIEKAQKIASILYQDSNISLPRKFEKANQIIKWQRPLNCKKVEIPRLKWCIEEDEILKINEFNANKILKLNLLPGRNLNAIKIRSYRIKNARSNLQ